MSIIGFITVIHIIVALFMVLVVLVQGGNSGGVGAAFGGGNSSGVFGASGATTFFAKLTYGAAFIFMLTSITLTINSSNAGRVGLTEKLEKAAATEETATPSEPAPTEGNETAPQPDGETQDNAVKPAEEAPAPQQ